MVLDPAKTTLWFATKELTREKQLKDFLGKNEKTKVGAPCFLWNLYLSDSLQVVVKLSTAGSGPPVREPMFNEEERKAMMMAEHRRREEVLFQYFFLLLRLLRIIHK